MPSWAPVTNRVIDHGFGASRGGEPVTGIVIHHVAGTNGLSYVANRNSRNSYPTYHIARNGRVTGIVHPDRRPFSSGSIDVNAVTVEIDNTRTGGQWPVSRAALKSLARIIAHHAAESPRAGHPAQLNRPGVRQKGFWVAWHQQVSSWGTACPGPYVIARLDKIVAMANGSSVGTAQPSREKKWGYWIDDVQKRVNALGYQPSLDVDGLDGPLTQAGVRWAQKLLGVAVDGKWGRKTQRAYTKHRKGSSGKKIRKNAPAFPLPTGWYFGPEGGPKWSVSGHHGHRSDLKRAQRELKRRGWTITPDGLYSFPDETDPAASQTGRIVGLFQRDKGLTVDHLLGPDTWKAIWEEPVT